jgi:AAA family ATP:ADP antiporter
VLGAAAVGMLVRHFEFTPFSLMALAALVLLGALGLTYLANRRETGRADERGVSADKEVLGKEGGFELVFKDRYLMWIAVLAILLNLVNSVGNFLLNSLIEREANSMADLETRRAFVTVFASDIDTAVAVLSVVLQLFVTSRAMRTFGVRGSLFILPILALVNYSVIAVVPVLAIIKWGKVLENSTDYSIQNTIRQALFLPTSREAKYKAKAAIDTFFTRFGDVMQAVVVFALTAIGIGAAGFAWLNVALTVAWLAVAGQIAREHRRRTV